MAATAYLLRRWVGVLFRFRDLWISLDYPLCPDGFIGLASKREASLSLFRRPVSLYGPARVISQRKVIEGRIAGLEKLIVLGGLRTTSKPVYGSGSILPGKILTHSRVSIGMLALVRADGKVKFFLERKSQRVDAL